MAMITKLTFEEPPPKKDRHDNSQSKQIIDGLRANPGKWARIEELPKTGNGCVREFCKRHGMTEEFEFCTRKDDVKGGYLVYARFVPESERAESE